MRCCINNAVSISSDPFAPDRYYSDEYADKIMKRANDPNAFVPIEIKLAK